MKKDKRTYAGEMEWAISEAMSRNNDRNPNRMAQVRGILEYGHAVGIARRSHEPMPERPKIENLI